MSKEIDLKANDGSEKHGKITKYMWIVLICGFMGWGLDGMDGNLYNLVIQPAMTELLGDTASPETIGFYGGLNVTLYLFGWATGGIVFGLLADVVGRVRMLGISILLFSIFTGMTGFATEWWHVGIFRFLTGLGSGAEWPIGAALIAETWKNHPHRVRACAVMMSGFAAGFFLASLIYRFVGPFGWRPVFFVGVLPALLVLYIRHRLEEPEDFLEVKQRRAQIKMAKATASKEEMIYAESPFKAIWRGPYRKHTIICIVMSSVALIGFWCYGAWVPSVVRELLTANGVPEAEFIASVSYATMIYNAGGFFGYFMWGFITDVMGRKATFAINLVGPLIIAPIALQLVDNYTVFMVCLFFIGFTIMGFFGGCAVYFPELYPPRMRVTALAVTNNLARYLTSVGPWIAGMLVAQLGSFANVLTAITVCYVVGAIALIFAKETKGAPLPVEDMPK